MRTPIVYHGRSYVTTIWEPDMIECCGVVAECGQHRHGIILKKPYDEVTVEEIIQVAHILEKALKKKIQ